MAVAPWARPTAIRPMRYNAAGLDQRRQHGEPAQPQQRPAVRADGPEPDAQELDDADAPYPAAGFFGFGRVGSAIVSARVR